ncbi:MAG: hypothetical protein K6G50_00225 [bacterium]|nr:hypothetical protein [bacterium]
MLAAKPCGSCYHLSGYAQHTAVPSFLASHTVPGFWLRHAFCCAQCPGSA